MIKAIIIDDEEHCCESLSIMLAKHCNGVQVLACAYSAGEGRKLIEKYQPDVVFLDVEMPKENGFNLLEKIGQINFDVIFTTAYNHYALQAIKFSALDYLLKPVDSDDLKRAVEKLEVKKSLNKKAENLVNNIKNNIKRLIISTVSGLEFIDINDIIWCRADSNYTLIYLIDGTKILATKSLKEFEELLKDSEFYRVHHSNLINLKHVRKYVKGDGGQVIMSDGTVVDVSSRKKSEFLSKLEVI